MHVAQSPRVNYSKFCRADVVKWWDIRWIIDNFPADSHAKKAVFPIYRQICMSDGAELNTPNIAALLSPEAFDAIAAWPQADARFSLLGQAGNWMNDALSADAGLDAQRILSVVDGEIVLWHGPHSGWARVNPRSTVCWRLTFEHGTILATGANGCPIGSIDPWNRTSLRPNGQMLIYTEQERE